MNIEDYKFTDKDIDVAHPYSDYIALNIDCDTTCVHIDKQDAEAIAKHFDLIDDWISVEDRLPKSQTDKFDVIDVIIVCKGEVSPARFKCGSYPSFWYEFTVDENIVKDVTHWRQLPLPPKP